MRDTLHLILGKVSPSGVPCQVGVSGSAANIQYEGGATFPFSFHLLVHSQTFGALLCYIANSLELSPIGQNLDLA